MNLREFNRDGIPAYWVGISGNYGLGTTHTVTVYGPILGDENRIAIRLDCCAQLMRVVRPESLHESEAECEALPCRNRKR